MIKPNANHLATAALVALAAFTATTTAISASMNNTSTAAPIPAQSTITAATVYTDRAIVTRAARVELPAGESSITLEKLPASLVDASLQVNARGSADATILDVTSRVTYTSNAAEVDQPRVAALQEQIKTTEQDLRKLTDRAALIHQQTTMLDQIQAALFAPPPAAAKTPPPTLETLEKVMTFSVEKRAQLAADTQALDTEITATGKKLDAQRAQLAATQNETRRDAKSYKTVTIRVAAATPGALDLTLAYTVPNASWTPAYDVRLRSAERAIELTYFGIVRQSTGEDWNNIALTLSTARPSLGAAAPDLKPWIVNVLAPRRQLRDTAASVSAFSGEFLEDVGATSVEDLVAADSFNTMAKRSAPASRKAAAAPPPPPTEATLATATVDATVTSATFRIAAATSIPSDNTPQKVSVTTTKLEAKLQYQATPAMQETAFLSAYVTNTTDYPFLAGPTNIFLDNAFVTTSALKTVMPLEKFELSLGADESVSIKRRVVNRFSENTGLTGKGRRVTYTFLITITNNKKTPERVVFKEALPLARNEKIVVKLLAPAEKDVGTLEKPGAEVTREEDNKLVWRLDLKPGEKREIPLKFSVDYPGDVQVTGLE